MMPYFADDLYNAGTLSASSEAWRYHPMMWMMYRGWGGNNGIQTFAFLWLITWILLLVALVAFIRWMWKKGDKVK